MKFNIQILLCLLLLADVVVLVRVLKTRHQLKRVSFFTDIQSDEQINKQTSQENNDLISEK